VRDTSDFLVRRRAVTSDHRPSGALDLKDDRLRLGQRFQI
jgi:hypothetical protein